MHKFYIEKNKNSFEFTVNKRQVNKYKALSTSVLFDKVEYIAKSSIFPYNDILEEIPKSFELNFVQNAYLNDELIVENQIKKLSNSDLELLVKVSKKQSVKNEIICEAVFGYTFKRAS
ncbi:hypothetical protein [Pseudotenacibaculum haliotis]|uniref:Uncharacterized protein n=1 Tax=Pseudotenacibaculum haliotis TaxID=1862138 RepID=A0ABW5LLN7_9FLAO